MSLRCGTCRTPFSIAEVVATATVSPWPAEQIVSFPCPSCASETHARLRDGIAEVVARSGPGLYRVYGAHADAELAVVGSPAGVEIWHIGQHRRVPKRTGWQPPQRRSDPASSA